VVRTPGGLLAGRLRGAPAAQLLGPQPERRCSTGRRQPRGTVKAACRRVYREELTLW